MVSVSILGVFEDGALYKPEAQPVCQIFRLVMGLYLLRVVDKSVENLFSGMVLDFNSCIFLSCYVFVRSNTFCGCLLCDGTIKRCLKQSDRPQLLYDFS